MPSISWFHRSHLADARGSLGAFIGLIAAGGCQPQVDSAGPVTKTTGSTETSTVAEASAGQMSICGDGLVETGEACDDGNLVDVDGCSNACEITRCGDGVVGEDEGCDDGNNVGGDSCSPTCEPTPALVDIGVAGDHTCALFEDGSLRCWGQNEQGALCNGDSEDLGDDPGELPVSAITTGGIRMVQLASGGWHSCALSDSGNVYCWGWNEYMQLGVTDGGCERDGTFARSVDLGESATYIAAGALHTCAIVTEGAVRCWGYNGQGQLGLSGGMKFPSPAVRLALGARHTCSLHEDGAVRCWGYNKYGQAGQVVVEPSDPRVLVTLEQPAPVVALNGKAVQVAAGTFHTCALLESGGVQCWGANGYGQLGNGRPKDGAVGDEIGEIPDQLVNVPLGVGAVEVALGALHSCARLKDNTVKCWGFAGLGSLGYGNKENVDLPGELNALAAVQVDGYVRYIRSSSGYDDTSEIAGGFTSCAGLYDGALFCWGENDNGQLGLGHRDTIGDDELPTTAAGPVPY